MNSECGLRNAEVFSRDRTDRRAAMTLVELMLVLILLVIICSLAAPLVEGSFSSVRLRGGADQILTAWSKARSHAIATGEIYQFRFQPSGGKYRVEPWAYSNETNDDTLQKNEEAQRVADPATSEPQWEELGLAERLTFAAGRRVAQETGGQRAVESLADAGSGDWSLPILFFPDGTTSSASVLLRNEREIYQRVTLRALTGVARVSDLLSKTEAAGAPPR